MVHQLFYYNHNGLLTLPQEEEKELYDTEELQPQLPLPVKNSIKLTLK